MTASTKSPTSRAIVSTVRAALRLLRSSSEQLSVSQLLALRSELQQTKVVVNGQMQAKQPSTFVENLLELSGANECFKGIKNWYSTYPTLRMNRMRLNLTTKLRRVVSVPPRPALRQLSHEDDRCRTRGRDRSPYVGNLFPMHRCSSDIFPPVQVPGPYALTPPVMDELPEYWYVVDRGTEVGIFTDK